MASLMDTLREKMSKCSKCKKDFPETKLNWIVINKIAKLVCDKCKKAVT
mgnify:CR=1 FL=1